MSNKVVLAEKPSVARDIAQFLGAKMRHDGYFEGNGFQVTWAFGHLVTLKEPDEYDPSLKKWSLATLPFVPKNFQLKLVENPGVRKQFGVIKRLLKSAEELICATDAGREGELIFRYILSLSECEKKPFKRLWLSSLTEEAMKKAFDQIRPGSDYDFLYAAAKCRSESDWIVGLNATRSFTVRYGRGEILWSVGRVQTPVLAMIVQRDEEIRNFISKPFWELKTRYREVEFKAKKDRFFTEEKGQDLLSQVKDKPFLVQKIESKEEKNQPPFLYDLTDLQRDMNKKYGMSASDTLQIAQTLYESKLISYPRTDSKFLGSDLKKEIPQIFSSLQKVKPDEIGKLDLKKLAFTSRVINDQKTGEHHAIIPTGKIPVGQIPLPSERVFEAVLTRLIAAFYPPCIKEVTTVEGESGKVLFSAKGIRMIDPGWMILYSKKEEGDKHEEEQELPSFVPNETGPHEPFLKQGKTEPPKHFTEGTLLSAMETAGKLVEDEELSDALKQKGLGTPATRAAIIETLLKRTYIAREKKTLTATHLGRYLIALIQEPNLKSPELTGEWECKLKKIEQGLLDPAHFMKEIVEYTQSTCKGDPFQLDGNELGKCPLCLKPVIAGKKGFGCSGWKEGCQFVLWKEYKGFTLTMEMVRSLIQRKVVPYPITISEGKVVLYLSEKGTLLDIPMQPQEKAAPIKKRYIKKTK